MQPFGVVCFNRRHLSPYKNGEPGLPIAVKIAFCLRAIGRRSRFKLIIYQDDYIQDIHGGILIGIHGVKQTRRGAVLEFIVYQINNIDNIDGSVVIKITAFEDFQ